MGFYRIPDVIARVHPALERRRKATLLRKLDTAVQRNPAQRLGEHEVLRGRPYFPDPVVRLLPAAGGKFDDIGEKVPVLTDFTPVLVPDPRQLQ